MVLFIEICSAAWVGYRPPAPNKVNFRQEQQKIKRSNQSKCKVWNYGLLNDQLADTLTESPGHPRSYYIYGKFGAYDLY